MNKWQQHKRYLGLWLVFLMMLTMAGCTTKNVPETTTRDDTTINVLYFSDFHGAVDNSTSSKNPGMDKFAAVIKEYTAKESAEEGYIVACGGDSYQGSAMSNLTVGKVISEMYSDLGLSYSAIGNHEYDWGTDKMEIWMEDGGFRFLAANIVYEDTGEVVEYADPYGIIEKNGRKIGFIGIATPETFTSTLRSNVEGLNFQDPVDIVNKYTEKLRDEEGVDAVIVLSHLGATQDDDGVIIGEAADLANKAEGVDAILTGHTHNYINGEVNGIPLLGTPNNGRALGILRLSFITDTLAVSTELTDLVPLVDELASDPDTKAIYDRYEEELDPLLNEVVTILPMDMPHERDEDQTVLGQFSSKLLTHITGAQIGLFNGGGIRTSLEAGDLTVGDMYTVFPFDNTIVTMDLSGADLKSNLEHGLDPDNGVGTLQYYGIKVTVNTENEEGNRIVSITLLDGTPVEDDIYYSVVTNDFMSTNGDNYNFDNAKNVTDTSLVLRDAMIDELKKTDKVDFTFEESYIEQ